MELKEYERMYRLEDTYWWFQGRLRMIETILKTYLPEEPRPGRVLDVGCGTGLMLQRLAKWRPVGLDFSDVALRFSRRRGLKKMLRGDVTRLPFQDNSLDLVLALDVMEHVERDDLMVREFHRVLRPGGCLMATVPSHPELWSDHDIALHHFRRYTYDSFRRILRHGNLRPIKYSYGISFTYFPIVAFRRIQRLWHDSTGEDGHRPRAHLIPLPRPINRTLISFLHIEAELLKHVDLPVGVSLMTLAQKPPIPSKGRTR